jgi:hypothetical protein
MVQESDYKKIYNVAECAGITDYTMGYTEATRQIYEKIADWINNDSYLSTIFSAAVFDTTSTRFYVKLSTKWGCGLGYGSTNSSTTATYNTIVYFTPDSSGDTYTIKTSTSSSNIVNLRLMVIESPYGIIADFFDATVNTSNQINMLLTTGKDNAEADIKIGFIMHSSSGYLRYVQNGVSTITNISLKTRSTSAKTGLFTYMPDKSDIICENTKLCDGAAINNQAFFEVNGQVWCSIRLNDSYVGFALRIA